MCMELNEMQDLLLRADDFELVYGCGVVREVLHLVKEDNEIEFCRETD